MVKHFLSILLFTLGAPSTREELPTSRAAFEAAGPQTKVKTMDQLLMRGQAFGATDAIDLLRAGLVDADPGVKLGALAVIVGWTIVPGLSQPDLVPAVRELGPLVTALLQDPDARVREESVLALGALDGFDPDAPKKRLRLSQNTVNQMAALYFRERSAIVRSAIAKALGISATDDSPEVRSVILAGLDDPSAGVRQYALMGAERLQLREALPALAKALRDPEAYVRFLAAKAMAAYDEPGYVQALEQALAVETDPTPRAQIQRALEMLRR